jgi:hypothetical protein
MRKIILFCSIHILCISTIFAQYPSDMKRDYIWFIGNNHATQSEGITKIDFNNNSPTYTLQDTLPLDFSHISTGICNENGHLLFYGNEDKVINSTYRIMENGEGLSTVYSPISGSCSQCGITIPLSNTNRFAHIHQGYNYGYPEYPIKKDTLLVTTIDMTGSNGRGSVISKNIPFFTDYSHTLSFKVCRHANGRDWWFIQPDTTYNKIHRFLITPNGIDTLAPQIMQNPPLPPNSWSNHTVFSPNGDKWASRISTNHFDTTVVVYDFDRCSGLLSNYKAFHRISETWCGLAFSLDSRYLYHSCGRKLMQYDLNSSNIAASEIILAQGYNLLVCAPNHLNGEGDAPIPIYTPNNILFIPIAQRTNKVHTINNPNGAGAACDLRLCDITLPAEYSYQSPPNFPNYRLGPVDGSACDTLGIDNIVSTENVAVSTADIRFYPNPAVTEFNLTSSNDLSGSTLELTDALGRTVLSQKLNQGSTATIDIAVLTEGIYFVRLYQADNILLLPKLIIVRP